MPFPSCVTCVFFLPREILTVNAGQESLHQGYRPLFASASRKTRQCGSFTASYQAWCRHHQRRCPCPGQWGEWCCKWHHPRQRPCHRADQRRCQWHVQRCQRFQRHGEQQGYQWCRQWRPRGQWTRHQRRLTSAIPVRYTRRGRQPNRHAARDPGAIPLRLPHPRPALQCALVLPLHDPTLGRGDRVP